MLWPTNSGGEVNHTHSADFFVVRLSVLYPTTSMAWDQMPVGTFEFVENCRMMEEE